MAVNYDVTSKEFFEGRLRNVGELKNENRLCVQSVLDNLLDFQTNKCPGQIVINIAPDGVAKSPVFITQQVLF